MFDEAGQGARSTCDPCVDCGENQHRHDQSVFSLLLKMHHFKSFPNPTAPDGDRDMLVWEAGFCSALWPLGSNAPTDALKDVYETNRLLAEKWCAYAAKAYANLTGTLKDHYWGKLPSGGRLGGQGDAGSGAPPPPSRASKKKQAQQHQPSPRSHKPHRQLPS